MNFLSRLFNLSERDSGSIEKESPPNYTKEFDQAIEKVKREQQRLNRKEQRRGESLKAVVLFGSLSNKQPKMEDEKTLHSDADVLLLYSGTKQEMYRTDPRGLSKHDTGPFTEHIPNADIVALNIATITKLSERSQKGLREELVRAKKAIIPGNSERSNFWMYVNKPNANREIVQSILDSLAKKYTVFPQMILTGTVLQGEIPTVAQHAARDVMDVYHEVVSELRQLRDSQPEA